MKRKIKFSRFYAFLTAMLLTINMIGSTNVFAANGISLGQGMDIDSIEWSNPTNDNPLGSAIDFNGFIFGDISGFADVEGAVATTGSVYSIQSICADENSKYLSHQVGYIECDKIDNGIAPRMNIGMLLGNGGECSVKVVNGNVVLGEVSNFTGGDLASGCQVVKRTEADIFMTDAEKSLKKQNKFLFNEKQNGQVIKNTDQAYEDNKYPEILNIYGKTIVFKGKQTDLNIFNINLSKDDFSDSIVIYDVPEYSKILMNITSDDRSELTLTGGTNANIAYFDTGISGVVPTLKKSNDVYTQATAEFAGRVLWNIDPSIEKIIYQKGDNHILGSVLAPNADFEASQNGDSSVNGTLVAKSATAKVGGAELHWFKLNDNAPVDPPTKEHIIIATADEGGSITLPGKTTVADGGNQSYEIKAETGYHIKDVLVDGKSIGVVEKYDFTKVTEDHTIHVSFEKDKETPPVDPPIKEHIIIATADEGGSITLPGKTMVADGGNQSYEIKAETGYHIKDVLVDGKSIGVVEKYDFTKVTEDHTIHVSFKKDKETPPVDPPIKEHIIIATADEGGSITLPGKTTVADGGNQSYEIKAETGYHIKDVLVDGKSIGVVEKYDFTKVTEDHTIHVSFEKDKETPPVDPPIKEHIIIATADEGGSITLPGKTTVADGGNQSYEIKAETGYHIKDVLVDGKSIGVVEKYDFTKVTEDHTIHVSFEKDKETPPVTPPVDPPIKEHIIIATADEGGSITLPGKTTVADGGNQSYEIKAEPGYHIKNVLVDGKSIGVVEKYDFTKVTKDHTIHVSFEKDASDHPKHHDKNKENPTVDDEVIPGGPINTPDESFPKDIIVIPSQNTPETIIEVPEEGVPAGSVDKKKEETDPIIGSLPQDSEELDSVPKTGEESPVAEIFIVGLLLGVIGIGLIKQRKTGVQ